MRFNSTVFVQLHNTFQCLLLTNSLNRANAIARMDSAALTSLSEPPAGPRPGFTSFDMDDREQREEKMRKGRFRLGVLTLFRGLQEKTTAHGLPHVHNARGQFLCVSVVSPTSDCCILWLTL